MKGVDLVPCLQEQKAAHAVCETTASPPQFYLLPAMSLSSLDAWRRGGSEADMSANPFTIGHMIYSIFNVCMHGMCTVGGFRCPGPF